MSGIRIEPEGEERAWASRAQMGAIAARYAAMSAMRASALSGAASGAAAQGAKEAGEQPAKSPAPTKQTPAPVRPSAPGSTFDTYA